VAAAARQRGGVNAYGGRDDNPAAIGRRMDELDAAMDAAIKEYGRLGEAAAQAASDEETAYAKAFLGAEGSMDIRKQLALLQTVNERFIRRVADHQVKVQEKVLYRLHDLVDMTRSKGANIRKEIELAQSGGRP